MYNISVALLYYLYWNQLVDSLNFAKIEDYFGYFRIFAFSDNFLNQYQFLQRRFLSLKWD